MLCFSISISFVPGNIYVVFTFAILCWLLLPHNKYWNKQCLYLLLFSIAYALIPLLNHTAKNSVVFLIYLLIPVAFYRFGRCYTSILKTDSERLSVLILILSSFLLFFFILVLKDIAIVGFINQTRQLLGDVGNDQTVRAATLYGLMSSAGLGCIAALYLKNIKNLHKLLLISISIFCLLAIVHLINRTGIVVLGLSLIMGYIISPNFKMNKLFPFILFLLLLGIIAIKTDLISDTVIEAYNSRETGGSGNTASAGGRVELWETALINLFTHPFGWNSQYAHNLWLDIARIGGIVAFIPFCFVTKRFASDWLRTARTKKTGFSFIILIITFSMLINSAVEPVIEGSIIFFSLEMMFWGILRSLIVENKIERIGKQH